MTDEFDIMPLAVEVTTALVTYTLTNCTGTASNPSSTNALIFDVVINANAGYAINRSGITLSAGSTLSGFAKNGDSYTLTITREATVASVSITVAAFADEFLDTAGTRQFAGKVKGYVDGRTAFRVTNVVVGTDVIDVTIE